LEISIEKYLLYVPASEQERVKKYSEEFTKFLVKQRISTKNKRTQKKIIKQALSSLPNLSFNSSLNYIIRSEKKQTVLKNAEDITNTFDFTRLSVSFMLKIGKQFFQEEKIFRYYYNQNHPECYKNKNSLVGHFKELVSEADKTVINEIYPLIQEQISN